MSGAGFVSRSGVLNYRRATLPKYRDIRDRPTWELLDVLYWQNDQESDFGGGIETSATTFNDTGIQGSYVRRALRKDPTDGTLFYDGTRQMSQLSLPFGNSTNDKLALLEDFYMVSADNGQNLHANGLASFDGFGVQAGAQIRWIALFQVLPEPIREQFLFLFEDQSTDVSNLPAYNLSVTSASGSWTGATNVIINPRAYDFETSQQPIEIYRGIN